MSGFYSRGENFDRIFLTEHQIVDNFIGTRAFSWGSNALGILGDNTTVSKSSPVDLSGVGNNWRQLSGGNGVSAGVKTDGTLWTWGRATYGGLGNGSTTASRSSPATVSGGGTDWKEVSVSNSNGNSGACAAIKFDGKLFTWGLNSSGQLGDGSTTNRSSPVSITTLDNWLHVAFGDSHVVAVTAATQLYTWGSNSTGQLGNGTTASRSSPGSILGDNFGWSTIAAGGSTSAGIKTDGTLWTWGSNSVGMLGDGTTVNKSSPVSVAGGGTNWERIDIGSINTVAATKIDGTLWTWGNNDGGQLGSGGGATASRSSPGTVAGGGTNWKFVDIGSRTMAGVKYDGTLWTWGSNLRGSLGDGSTVSRSSPGTTVGGMREWQRVYCGSSNTAEDYVLALALVIR